jgi:hypothetical protein
VPIVTIVVGSLLIALGIVGYVMTGMESPTALIPVFFGAILEACGLIALRTPFRKHAMHAAVLLGVLGIAGTARALPKLGPLLSGAQVERPAAVAAQGVMALILIVYVVLAVRSFIQARRQA